MKIIITWPQINYNKKIVTWAKIKWEFITIDKHKICITISLIIIYE